MEKRPTMGSVGTFEFNEENRCQGDRWMNCLKSANFYNEFDRLGHKSFNIKQPRLNLNEAAFTKLK